MPTPTVSPVPLLTSFKVLSFDIYGTLVDWESSIIKQLLSLNSQSPKPSDYASQEGQTALAQKFNHYEHKIQVEQPTLRYDKVLTEAYYLIAKDFSIDVTDDVKANAATFGDISTWSAFPDSVDAMRRLSGYYKLIPLSNVDRTSFQKTATGPLKGVLFWRTYLAEDIGSYKPDLANFRYLLDHADKDDKEEGGSGVEKGQILHVAQSCLHDHVPAKKMGLSSVWITRAGEGAGMGGDVKGVHERGEVGYALRCEDLKQLADLVEEAFEKEKK